MTEQAGDAYAELIKEQLAEERLTKSSLEARGIGVITTSGALVSLLFALAAVVTKSTKFFVTDFVRSLLTLAAAAFLMAAVLGIFVNRPRNYREPRAEHLRPLTEREDWMSDAQDGARSVARNRIDVLEAASTNNGKKANLLAGAMIAEVAGIALVAWAVVKIL